MRLPLLACVLLVIVVVTVDASGVGLMGRPVEPGAKWRMITGFGEAAVLDSVSAAEAEDAYVNITQKTTVYDADVRASSPHPSADSDSQAYHQYVQDGELFYRDDPGSLNVITADELVINRKDRLGKGSSAQVFSGRWLGRRVAIKIARSEKYTREGGLSRLEEEAKLILSLQSSPNIVRVLGIVYDLPDGGALVMEHGSGVTLDDLLFEHEPKLSLAQRAAVAAQLAIGVEYIHERGIIHHDLKTDNVIIDMEQGSVKLLDFGLATDTTVEPVPITYDYLIGTSGYMAPEIVNFQPHDAKVDSFALGVLLWEIFSGEPAFPHVDTDEVTANLNAGPVSDYLSLSLVPPPIAELLTKTWEKDPAKRPTVKEIATLVRRFAASLRDARRQARRTAASERKSKKVNKNDS